MESRCNFSLFALKSQFSLFDNNDVSRQCPIIAPILLARVVKIYLKFNEILSFGQYVGSK